MHGLTVKELQVGIVAIGKNGLALIRQLTIRNSTVVAGNIGAELTVICNGLDT